MESEKHPLPAAISAGHRRQQKRKMQFLLSHRLSFLEPSITAAKRKLNAITASGLANGRDANKQKKEEDNLPTCSTEHDHHGHKMA